MSRRISAILLVCWLVTAPSTGAAEEPDWTLQVDPLTTALGFVHVQVERTFGDHVSVYVGPHLRLFSSPLSDPEAYIGLGTEVGVRWYLFGTAPHGWWALARGVGAYLQTTHDGPEVTAIGGYGSLLGGYTWIVADWLVLSLGAGGQYLHYTVDGLGPKTFAPALHTAVGVAF